MADTCEHAATYTAPAITVHGPYVIPSTEPLTRCCTCKQLVTLPEESP
ncbi:hypothetical protein [Janibacter terrae]